MLFAPALADRAILPKAWGSSYFFNRIGQKQTFKHYLELSRGTFLKLKGPRMWTFSLLLITC